MRPTALNGSLAAAVLAVLPLLTLTPRGEAQTFTWTGASNPNWKTNGNWLGGVAPTGNGGENLVFPSGAANLLTSNNLNNGSFNSIIIKGSGYTLSNKPSPLAPAAWPTAVSAERIPSVSASLSPR